MVKHNKPVSPQPEGEAIDTGHPLLRQMTQTDAFAKAAADRIAAKEFQIAELETWKETVNAMAASPMGKLFIKSMVQHSGMFDAPTYRDTMKMVDVRLKSEFYLKWVRPFLNHDLRSAIE